MTKKPGAKPGNKPKNTVTIRVCHGHRCCQNFSAYTFERAAQELDLDPENGGENVARRTTLEKSACLGMCAKGPNIAIIQNGHKKIQTHVNSIEMGKIIKTQCPKGKK